MNGKNEQYIYGLHSVKALILHKQRQTHKIWINCDRHDHKIHEIAALAKLHEIPINTITSPAMNQMFGEYTHQGVVALTTTLPQLNEHDLLILLAGSKPPCLILILDGVTDPQNLGACLRTADAAGVDFIIIPKNNNAQLTPTVSKVACGAAESVSVVVVTNLVRAIATLKQAGVWVFGADAQTNVTLYSLDFSCHTAIVVGAEGRGLRRLTSERCDKLFRLPMLGHVTSLNVSVATGVILYEIMRQRIK